MADIIDRILAIAVSQIGTTEYPPGSNNVKYNTAYYGQPVHDGLWGTTFAWCAVFVWWCFRMADASDLFYGGKKTASCTTLANYYKSKGQFIKRGGIFKRGDIVFFDWKGGNGFDHVGFIERVNADGTYTTDEGNTSLTNNDNGGSVMRRIRTRKEISGAARPYVEDEIVTINDLMTLLKDASPEERRAIGKELDSCVYDYRKELDAPAWADKEFAEAISLGITDGSRPMTYPTRLEASIMSKRAAYEKK